MLENFKIFMRSTGNGTCNCRFLTPCHHYQLVQRHLQMCRAKWLFKTSSEFICSFDQNASHVGDDKKKL